MTKDEMSTLLRGVGCDENTITAMENAYEMGFEHGAQVSKAMREAIEFGVSMCEHLDFDEVPSAKAMGENFRRVVEGMQ
jgi:hypothetical protein